MPYYYAVALISGAGTNYVRIVDKNSHPFIYQQIEHEMGREVIILFWKEITEDEYNFFDENLQ